MAFGHILGTFLVVQTKYQAHKVKGGKVSLADSL